jgi:hypothetical protein
MAVNADADRASDDDFDVVDEASAGSFPASDAPGWATGRARRSADGGPDDAPAGRATPDRGEVGPGPAPRRRRRPGGGSARRQLHDGGSATAPGGHAVAVAAALVVAVGALSLAVVYLIGRPHIVVAARHVTATGSPGQEEKRTSEDEFWASIRRSLSARVNSSWRIPPSAQRPPGGLFLARRFP